MAMEESSVEPISFPRFARRALGDPAGLPLTENAVYRQTAASVSEDAPVLSAGAFLDELETLEQVLDREETMGALVSLSQAEVRALIRKAAKAKGRYLAALIDFSDSDIHLEQGAAQLNKLRKRHEELSRGVALLKSLILDGEIMVKGVEH